jgi:hypothetical protein
MGATSKNAPAIGSNAVMRNLMFGAFVATLPSTELAT